MTTTDISNEQCKMKTTSHDPIREDRPDKNGRWPMWVIEADLAGCYAAGSEFSRSMVRKARKASRGIKCADRRREYIQANALDFED